MIWGYSISIALVCVVCVVWQNPSIPYPLILIRFEAQHHLIQ